MGIQRLHSEGIIYRDLKPENVLLSNSGHVVLTDFGLSKQFILFEDRTTTFCGTAEYLAPEILLGHSYNYAVDWWSLGTFLYEMLVGITPFWADTTNEMYQRVLSDPLEFPPNMPSDAEQLIQGLLQRNPQQRFGIEQIESCAFFHDVIWDAELMKKLNAPFIPMFTADDDLTYFDDSFLQLPAHLTPTQQVIGSLARNAFLGFSYADGPAELK
jgi:serine/threonine protein kinase